MAVNGLVCIMTEIRKCLINSLFYLFDMCLMAVTLTTCGLVLAHFQDIDANMDFGL